MSPRPLAEIVDARASKVRAGDVTLRIQEWGEGPPLVLVHGLGMSSDLWWAQAEAFGRVRRVIAIDLRGFGESDKPTTDGAYRIERNAEDLRALLDALGLARVDLLGTSMGGFVGQAFALLAPERLSRLILCHTASRMSIPPEILEARTTTLRTGSMEEYGRMVAEQALAPGADPVLRDWLAGVVVRNDREAYRRVLVEGLSSFDLTPRVPEIRTPTLVVVGELDRVIPAAAGRELAATIPGAELVEISGVGHLGYCERPDAFNDPVLEFLRRTDAASV